MTTLEPSLELLLKYQKAIAHARMGFWEIDFSTGDIKWDEGARLLYEITELKFTGNLKNWLTRIHPDDVDRLKSEIENSRFDLGEMDSLFRLPFRRGGEKFIRTNAIKIRNDKNEVIGLVGLNWDVTEQQRLQVDLNKSKVFLEKILDAIPDPIFIKDANHRTIFANQEFVRLADRKKSDLIGYFDSDFLPAETAKTYWQQDSQVLGTDTSFEFEETLTDSQGNDRQLLTKKTSLQISDQQKVLVGVIRDITEIKNIQNSLIEQSKMASLGEMAAEIAHEINNPLMIIQAKAQILLTKLKENGGAIDLVKLPNDLKSIENNSVRIDKIIKSLKSVSRKSDMDPFAEVSILRLIDEAIEISRERLTKAQIQFEFKCDKRIDSGHKIWARGSEIVQVLVNLLNNSFDAIILLPSPWIKIELQLKNTNFQIEVSDSGDPINPDIILMMMQPFFTTKKAGSGTGLGLSVSKQIIKNHNGNFYFDPTSKNTKFVVQLKRSDAVSSARVD